MNMSKREYLEYVKKMSPPSPVGKDMLRAFLSGGAICALGQLIRNGWLALELSQDDAGLMTSVTLIFLGALLTGMNVYSKLAHYAGAGTLVPITGFANSIAAPAMEFRTEGPILGTAVKMFTIAGPVLVYGLAAGILYGVLYCLLPLP